MLRNSAVNKLFLPLILLSFISSAKGEISKHDSIFDNYNPRLPTKPRTAWLPVGSFFLPGLGQYFTGQTQAGIFYSGYATAGLAVESQMTSDTPASSNDQSKIDSRNNNVRQSMLGGQMYQTAGSFSAYQTFRSSAQIYRASGTGYGFLQNDDTSADIALAPFDFSLATDPRVYVPLGIALALTIAASNSGAHYINGSDIGYLSAFSYQAGVGEEAVFRGWMMPAFR